MGEMCILTGFTGLVHQLPCQLSAMVKAVAYNYIVNIQNKYLMMLMLYNYFQKLYNSKIDDGKHTSSIYHNLHTQPNMPRVLFQAIKANANIIKHFNSSMSVVM